MEPLWLASEYANEDVVVQLQFDGESLSPISLILILGTIL